MITELDKAYLAGVIDSDGCIRLERTQPKNRKNLSYCPRILVTQTRREVCEWIGEIFGGPMMTNRRGKTDNSNSLYTWRVSGTKAIEMCKLLEPYLKIKAPRARVLIEYEETLFDNRDREEGTFLKIPKKILDKKERLYQKLKKLNRRGKWPG